MPWVMAMIRGCAAGLQLVAACLWLLPQQVLAAPVLILPQAPGGLWLLPLTDPGRSVAESGDAQLFLAQSTGCGSDCPSQPPVSSGGGSGGSSSSGYDAGPQGISPAATQKIAQMFLDAAGFCRQLDLRYRVDCLYAKFRKIAQALPKTGDYAPLRAALVRAADRLEDVVDDYADPAAGKISPRLRSQPAAERIRPLSPIRADLQAIANQATTEIITELSTTLLRSSTGSERRQLAFQQIATAIDSTKVLLRSA